MNSYTSQKIGQIDSEGLQGKKCRKENNESDRQWISLNISVGRKRRANLDNIIFTYLYSFYMYFICFFMKRLLNVFENDFWSTSSKPSVRDDRSKLALKSVQPCRLRGQQGRSLICLKRLICLLRPPCPALQEPGKKRRALAKSWLERLERLEWGQNHGIDDNWMLASPLWLTRTFGGNSHGLNANRSPEE